MVSLVGTAISMVIGIVLGLLAGFRGGKTDTFISRLIDIFLSLPLLLIAISLAVAAASASTAASAIIKPGVGMVIFIIALFGWPYVARIVRGQTLSLREREFVEASRATGFGTLAHHVARDPAEPDGLADRRDDPADPAEHPVRGGAVLPRRSASRRARRRGAA